MTTDIDEQNADVDVRIDEKDKFQVDDLLETFDWPGSTPEQLDIDEKYTDSLSIGIKGSLFNAPAEGTAFFDPTDIMRRIIHEIILYVYTDDLSFADCLKHLKDNYGKAYLSGEEPYVEVNGGAVDWHRFYTGKGVIRIFKGQKNNFYTLSYVECEPPAEYIEATRPLKLEELGPLTGYYLELPDFEDLIISPVYEDQDSEKPLYYELEFGYKGIRYMVQIHKNVYDEYQTGFKYDIYEEGGWKYLSWDAFKDKWLVISEPSVEDEKMIEVIKVFASALGYQTD